MKQGTKLAIITCCLDDWGGSEELWAKTVPHLLSAGINDITVYKNTINFQHPKFKVLKKLGVKLIEIIPKAKAVGKIYRKSISTFIRIAEKFNLATYQWNKLAESIFKQLKKDKIDFAIISQGINFDGLVYAHQCLKLKIPYIIVSHKAVDFFWPQDSDRAYMRETLLKAKKCLFVSIHNLKTTEEQFGIRLKNAEVILNPTKVIPSALPYPSTINGFKLACVGRLFVIDKGQDILIRILSNSKWKERAVTISLIGKGPDEQALKELCALFEIKNVEFIGFKADLNELWHQYHALILPSRSEGLPLTVIEAMSLGRTVIVTNAGGNAEIIEENVTGFIGEANVKDFDEVMESAWQARENWEKMGNAACEKMKLFLAESPEKIFAELILEQIN
ncbi:glycosyltransferase involved in cell wall biosynthesis [Pedobacter sp. UYP30]|uniref:glycosyltransferase family 4 protein n=1 Tax=Pedobacter sp. UYP30 TaxID=1756400 RepID=UPI003394CAB9